jgi:biotin carboxyl carrier protein
MIKAIVNGHAPHEIVHQNGSWTLDGSAVQYDAQALPGGGYSIIYNGKSYIAHLVEQIPETKTVVLQIGSHRFEVQLEEPLDRLLAAMGIQEAGSRKINDVKAPMPGLILKILVEPGQSISKGEPLLVLEAMKMENVFKAAADAVVKEIRVAEKDAVEKGQVLLVLE